MNLRIFFVVFSLSYLLTVPLTAARDKQPFVTVLNQLELAKVIMGLDSYKPVGNPIVDLLDEDNDESYEITLDGGREHVIVVVCDDDCDDVDVSLYSKSGDLIDKDDDNDGTAIITGVTTYTGRYYLNIELSDCDADPCAVAANAYKN